VSGLGSREVQVEADKTQPRALYSVGQAIPKQGNWTAGPARRSCGRADGRATNAAPDRWLASHGWQDVRRLQAHQVVFTPVPLRIGGETIRVPEPGTFQVVPDATGVAEPGLPHL
jgi:hypothetical protein